MQYTVFSKGEGCGYISESPEVDARFKPDPVNFLQGSIQANETTTLFGFFRRELKYLGRDGNELLFSIGSHQDLFGETHYYKVVFQISDTRIFLMYANNSGRDYNWKNDKWK